MALTPRPYQLEGRDFLARTRIALLADEMRVGKTPQFIMAAHKVNASSVTVLGPAISVPMWKVQFPRWWEALGGLPQPRLKVMSFERGLLYRAALLDDMQDVTGVDECHFAGNPDAARTKLIYGKDGLVWKSGALWALSGTPAPKHGGSLWPLLRAAGVFNGDYMSFLHYFCRLGLDDRPIGTKEARIPELRALWQQIGLRRTKKEVRPDMKDIEFDFLPVGTLAAVDLQTFGHVTDEQLLEAVERTADVDREDRVAVAMAKAERVVAEVEFALANDLLKQTVIFGWHLEPMRKMTASLNAMGFKAAMLYGGCTERQKVEIQEKFKLGLLDVVVGQIRACGTAIDLSAASHGYFVELDWLPTNNMQAANRLVSLDKAEGVTIDVATMPGSVDDRVQRVLVRRARELNALI